MSNFYKKILGQNKTGYAYGITVCNEIFIGNIRSGWGTVEYFKNTKENLKYVRELFNVNKTLDE